MLDDWKILFEGSNLVSLIWCFPICPAGKVHVYLRMFLWRNIVNFGVHSTQAMWSGKSSTQMLISFVWSLSIVNVSSIT